jgi:hypothetical protein
LAISIPEKFAQNRNCAFPTIVSTRYDTIRSRILFFAPFIPGMPANQFEFGVIPSFKPQKIEFNGTHGGIHEYTVGD